MSRNNIPSELVKFNKLFRKICYRNNNHKVFDDFLDLFINGFSFNHNIDLVKIRKEYTQEDRNNFGELIKEAISLLDKQIVDDQSFYDVFGTFYEIESLTNKHFNQFFTPIDICTFITKIVNPTGKSNFSDPCSGSARLSLAANSVNIGMFHTLIDIDYTCAKMSALNLMLHGINGIVICDDSLFPRSFRGAFIVNRYLRFEKIPRIEYVANANSAYTYVRKTLGISVTTKTNTSNEKYDPNKDVKEFIVNNKTNQISLF